jgi:hypothetical protein
MRLRPGSPSTNAPTYSSAQRRRSWTVADAVSRHWLGGESARKVAGVGNRRLVLLIPLTLSFVVGASPGEAIRATSGAARNGPVTVITGATGGAVSAVLPPGRLGAVYNCNCELASIDWAPDGKRLAFAAATVSRASPFNGVHIRDMATGKDRHLRRDGFDLAWSADGRRIAYVEWATFGYPHGTINVLDARTARRERIIETGSEGTDSSPSWSPRGDRLAFASLNKGVSTISVIALNGLKRTVLARRASAPAWSPLGDKIAYRGDCGIKLVSPAGRDVTPRRRRRCRGIGVVGRPFWSPDGRSIGIQTRHGIYAMKANGSDLGLLLTSESGFGVFSTGVPTWRPQSPSPPT